MGSPLSIVIKTIIFFIAPGIALLMANWYPWDEPLPDIILSATQIIGWAAMCIGVLFIITQLKKSKRRQHENEARKKVEMMGKSVPLAYEGTAPLTEADLRLLKRHTNGIIALLIPFACLPLSFLLFVDEDTRIMIYVSTAFWASVVAVIGSQTYSNFTRIRDSNQKTVIKGIITERFKKYETTVKRHNKESSTTVLHHLKIGDIELRVPFSMYKQYNIGDAVEFHYAPMYFFGKKQHNTFFAKIKLEGAGMYD